MKKFFFTYNSETGQVASYSKGKNKVSDKFVQTEIEVTDEQFQQILQNYILKIQDNTLVTEKPQHVINEEKVVAIEEAKKTLREKGDKVTTKELSTILQTILQKL